MSLSPDELSHALLKEFGLTPVMAAEIECYVPFEPLSEEQMDVFWAPLDLAWRADKMPLLRIEKERGTHQYEVVTQITTPSRLADFLTQIKRQVLVRAQQMHFAARFDAKPYADEPSSGLHLHLHLADAEGINAYHKTEEWTADALRWSMGGLIAALPSHLPVFFPNPQDFLRLDDIDHVPKIAGWGVNNRYCALRIPAIEDPYDKRIEHRVPCASADPHSAIAAMLEGVLHGLRERIEPPEQQFGKPTVGLLKSLAIPPAELDSASMQGASAPAQEQLQ